MILKNVHNKESAKYWEMERERRIEAAIKLARIKAIEEIEDWSTAEDEDDDVIKSSVLAPYKPRSAKIQAQIRLHAKEAKAQACNSPMDNDDAELVKREASVEAWASRSLKADDSTIQADCSTGIEVVMALPIEGGDETFKTSQGFNRLRYRPKP